MLQAYKHFVREHSALVLNLERLAHWVAWSPERFNGSEVVYEAFNAAVGLLGLYNDSIISGEGPAAGEQTDYGFLLAALEQVGRARGCPAAHPGGDRPPRVLGGRRGRCAAPRPSQRRATASPAPGARAPLTGPGGCRPNPHPPPSKTK
jgi:hypothetical protein